MLLTLSIAVLRILIIVILNSQSDDSSISSISGSDACLFPSCYAFAFLHALGLCCGNGHDVQGKRKSCE